MPSSALMPRPPAVGPTPGGTPARVRAGLEGAADRLAAAGMPRPRVDGKLLRPRVAFLAVPEAARPDLDHRFWLAALALQMVHEASLIHDDVVDGASVRRGRPTLVAQRGVGPAVVAGDHLLTCAYRAASMTGSPEFMERFAAAVERTVAGEVAQGRARGRVLGMAEYRDVVAGKTGRLFGCAVACGTAILRTGNADRLAALGEEIGVFYQMVDDFLDLCPTAATGKAPFQDYKGRVWTWPLADVDPVGFALGEAELTAALFGTGGGSAPMDGALTRLRREAARLESALLALGSGSAELAQMIHGWADAAARARAGAGALEPSSPTARASSAAGAPERPSPAITSAPDDAESRVIARARALGGPEHWPAYFGRNSRSFRFAARLFPSEPRSRVTEVYAFCRFTDDLVDERPDVDPAVVAEELDAWSGLARQAHEGRPTGVPVLDATMGAMSAGGVPLHYALELIEGVRMDLRPRRYETMAELRTYTYRVASVVGGWLTQLFGGADPWLLARAFSLGHAMQLTNIVRDVGEDLRDGRIYLPRDRMARRGLTADDLREMAAGAPVTGEYRALIEDLMLHAEREYDLALQAIPALPTYFRRPVAVASHVYRGIHAAIRGNGYDNFRLRARTGPLDKLLLASRALWALRHSPARSSEVLTPSLWVPLTTAERSET